MFRNLMVGGLSLAMLAVLQGCGAGGPSEKDTNPKGVKVDSGQGDKK